MIRPVRGLIVVVGVSWLLACSGTEGPPKPRQEPLVGGPYPALLVAQAQFHEQPGENGKPKVVPGAAKLQIVRETDAGWASVVLEDPDSNVFHKAVAYDGGILTIGGTQAMLKYWSFADGKWNQTTHWNPTFGGRFDRLRDMESGDVDGDGKPELVIATHDQGVIAVIHPDEAWRVEEVDREAGTFVHEIEVGDFDGDGVDEFFATPSAPNKPDQEQPGEVRMYRHSADGYTRTVVAQPHDTHAKEILVADVDQDGHPELYVAWEGAISSGSLARPVSIEQFVWREGGFEGAPVGQIEDRQLRAMAAGDVNGDGKIDLVAGAMRSGLWLFEQGEGGWRRTLIDGHSSGYEHPVHLADLDGDGQLEIYVGSEDQQELRQYRFVDGQFQKRVIGELAKGDITWNITDGRF